MQHNFHAYLCYVDLDVCLCKSTESTRAARTDLRASWSVVGQRCAVITPRCLLSNSPQMIGQPLNDNICLGPPLPEVPPTSTPRPFFLHPRQQTDFLPTCANIDTDPCEINVEEVGSQQAGACVCMLKCVLVDLSLSLHE